jgi:N-acetylmuramoyl-L-alanine amidase
MPSVLVEVGFISHTQERNYMLSENGKSALSASIFNAFKDYKKKIEDKSSFTIHTESGNSVKTDAKSNQPKLQSANHVNIEVVSEKKATNIFYSVQIAASKNKIDPSPANFKGEKNVFRIESKDMVRYYSGRFDNNQDAVKEKYRIEKKFPECFVVAFQNNEIISDKKGR